MPGEDELREQQERLTAEARREPQDPRLKELEAKLVALVGVFVTIKKQRLLAWAERVEALCGCEAVHPEWKCADECHTIAAEMRKEAGE